MLQRLFARHLEDDEQLHLIVHKHWLLAFRRLAFPVAAFLGTWLLFAIAPVAPIAAIVLIADLAIAIWLLQAFLDEFLDAWIITDRSVIDVAWHGWFHRQSTRIDYGSIEGVSYEVKGILGTLLGFGTVSIEKVGTGSIVSLENVPHPRDVESAILHCQETCLRTKNLKDSSAVQDLLAEIVAERMHLKQDKKPSALPSAPRLGLEEKGHQALNGKKREGMGNIRQSIF